jgi:hypothetical protein
MDCGEATLALQSSNPVAESFFTQRSCGPSTNQLRSGNRGAKYQYPGSDLDVDRKELLRHWRNHQVDSCPIAHHHKRYHINWVFFRSALEVQTNSKTVYPPRHTDFLSQRPTQITLSQSSLDQAPSPRYNAVSLAAGESGTRAIRTRRQSGPLDGRVDVCVWGGNCFRNPL